MLDEEATVKSIETERLVIRNFATDDWTDLQEISVKYRASQYAQYDQQWPTSADEVKGMVEWFAADTEHPSALSLQVQALLAEAIQVPPDQITPDLAFGDLPQWDSMGHMEVMMRLEEQFVVEIKADTIIIAIGNRPNPLIPQTSPDLDTTKWGTIVAHEETMATTKKGVFAGGDIVSGAATVISAMGQAKTAALSIHRYLMKKDPPGYKPPVEESKKEQKTK